MEHKFKRNENIATSREIYGNQLHEFGWYTCEACGASVYMRRGVEIEHEGNAVREIGEESLFIVEAMDDYKYCCEGGMGEHD